MQPIKDFVLIKPDPSATKIGSIIIPEQARKESQRGTIIATGPGILDDWGNWCPMQTVAGDVVLFGKYAGIQIEIEGEPHRVLREIEVLAVLD